ncbi:serine protease-like protein [Leptotrombidium deliense]|uniref:Serine protease-like protein n=1 Tax=Leptotrombidium deliense TaxID=299467 RepID=A0A443S0V9_9ACAR|nr:serine protease-like protein [Leptotrombidium deliense]
MQITLHQLLRADFSNYGSVVDIIAPGVDCYSADFQGGYLTISGTSMSTPLVAGWAAILRSANPKYTNVQLRQKIIEYSVNGTMKNVPSNTVNRFINVRCPIPPTAFGNEEGSD